MGRGDPIGDTVNVLTGVGSYVPRFIPKNKTPRKRGEKKHAWSIDYRACTKTAGKPVQNRHQKKCAGRVCQATTGEAATPRGTGSASKR